MYSELYKRRFWRVVFPPWKNIILSVRTISSTTCFINQTSAIQIRNNNETNRSIGKTGPISIKKTFNETTRSIQYAAANKEIDSEDIKNYEDIPLVKGIPFLGTAWPFISGEYKFGNVHELIKKRFLTYGKIYREKFMFDVERVYTCDPYDWEVIYKSHEGITDVNRSLWSLKAYSEKHNLPYSYIDTNDKEFIRRRDQLGKSFLQPKKIKEYIPLYSDAMDDFLNMFDDVLGESEGRFIQNMKQYVSPWLFECFGLHSFRVHFNMMDKDPAKREPAANKIIQSTKVFFELFHVIESNRIHKYASTKEWKRYEKCLTDMYDGTRELIEKYQKDYLIDTTTTDVTKEEKLTNLLDNFRGATDTVSNTLIWLFYELSRHPEVQDKLYKEVSQVLNKGNQLTTSLLQEMPYLRAVIKEIFRMHPLVPLSGKNLQKDVVISGYKVPAGKAVIMSLFHYDEEKYFDEPNKMIPERWMSDKQHQNQEQAEQQNSQLQCPMSGTATMKQVPKFASVPFGHGPRACVGRRIAETLLYVYIAKFINKYKIHSVKDDMELEFTFFMIPKTEIDCKIEKRS